MFCAFMALFSQSNHPIGLKFHQHQRVTIIFNPNDQDWNTNLRKSSGHQTISYVSSALTNFI